MAFRSALYAGQVWHQRLRPVQHRFCYRVDSFLFDLDELGELDKRLRLFSINRFNLFSLYWRDLGARENRHPRAYLEALLKREGFITPLHRAALLCYPRILGYTFNPLSIYYCYNQHGQPFAVVYEVSNTFGERHSYVMKAYSPSNRDAMTHSADKAFYVSPFMGMNQRYHFTLKPPGEQLTVLIRQDEAGAPIFSAGFHGRHKPFSDATLARSFLALPLMTVKVTAAIHWQALKLWCKGLKIQPRPPKPAPGKHPTKSQQHSH